jgi:predicted phosphohydrolase
VPVPDGDTLVVAGDVTRRGEIFDLMKFLVWLNGLPHKNKVLIAGNHDFCFQRSPDRVAEMLEPYDIYYLQDSAIILDGVKFYGSPWQPEFFDWAFNLPRGDQLKRVWAQIPDDVNILVTHGPPHGILDRSARDERTGCEDLRARIAELGDLDAHVFGHIHEGYGTLDTGGVRYVNASVCDLGYSAVNRPVVLSVDR